MLNTKKYVKTFVGIQRATFPIKASEGIIQAMPVNCATPLTVQLNEATRNVTARQHGLITLDLLRNCQK